MRICHLSDLHIGKRLMGYSMIDDQRFILKKILEIIDDYKVDSIIIAGDVYDKSVPSVEAVTLFDWFLSEISSRGLPVFIISGNHDCAERLSFGSKILSSANVFVSAVFDGKIHKHVLNDEYGKINVFMLPFVKPANVRQFFPNEEIDSYDKAAEVIMKNTLVDENERNVIVCHQFVTGAKTCESEEIITGSLENISVSAFDKFDYAALGHIHSPQKIVRSKVRYCGTPLKYSFSEVSHKKSVTIVDLFEKGNVKLNTAELKPLHDLREIKGKYEELTSFDYYKDSNTEDYLHIILTDEEYIPNVLDKLRSIYPNIMKLDYDNKRTRALISEDYFQTTKLKGPLELFGDFYKEQNGSAMNEEQNKFIKGLIEEIWEGE